MNMLEQIIKRNTKLASNWLLNAVDTTGGGFFAECLRHSAKADIHSAKPLPSVTLGKGRSVNSLSAKTSLPSANMTLGKEKSP